MLTSDSRRPERADNKERNVEDQIRSEILKTIPYGFYITGVVGSDGEVNGFTTCWVSQVSFDPQQVIVAVRKDQHTHDLVEDSGVFSLNFLDTGQEDLARRFTEPLQHEDGLVGGSSYTTGETGAPLFEEATSSQPISDDLPTSSPTWIPRWSTEANHFRIERWAGFRLRAARR
jgi:flavin reductase (DIM6/NTAB) family NADH-FMN oxidoreductase RutF